MRKNFLQPLFFLVLIISGCSYSASNPCDDHTQSEATPTSWSWFQLVIGASSSDELVTHLGKPDSKTPTEFRQTLACVYFYRQLPEGTVAFYIISGRVKGIEFYAPEYPLQTISPTFLNDAVTLYGQPELVGYNSTYGSGVRTVVWASKGIMAAVSAEYEYPDDNLTIDIHKAQLLNILYFAPTNVNDYTNSVWSIGYSDTQPNSDVVDILPKDPFIWEK